jgi:branched-subunit amino acid ABC-type transport system permease component
MISPYMESILIFAGINIILAISWYVPHCAGLISIGQGGFMAIGAYVSAYLSLNGIPFYLALIIAMLVSAGIGLLVSLPALRLREDYLAIVTLAIGEILRLIVQAEDSLAHGVWGNYCAPCHPLVGHVCARNENGQCRASIFLPDSLFNPSLKSIHPPLARVMVILFALPYGLSLFSESPGALDRILAGVHLLVDLLCFLQALLAARRRRG